MHSISMVETGRESSIKSRVSADESIWANVLKESLRALSAFEGA